MFKPESDLKYASERRGNFEKEQVEALTFDLKAAFLHTLT